MLKFTNYFIYLLFISLFISCSESDILDSREENSPSLRTAGDGKYDVLGYGYDVTTEYLNYKSIKSSVLNIQEFIKKNPHRFDNPFIGVISSRMFGGEDYYSFKKEIIKQKEINLSAWFITQKQAEKSLFNSGFTKKTTSSYSIESHNSFVRADIIKRQRQLYVDANPSELSAYLSPNFKEDLNKLSPTDIIIKYGTHVLIDIEIGGMYKGNQKSTIVSETNSYLKEKIVKGSASLNFKSFGLGFDTSISTSEATVNASKHLAWEFYLESCGGTTNGQSSTITIGNPYPTVTINQGSWAESVTDKTSVLVDVNWKKTYPIYEFISDLNKKNQIKKAYKDYILSKAVEKIETLPLYRLWQRWDNNTFYTTSYNEALYYVNNHGFVWDYGKDTHYIQGYVYKNQLKETVPLYRLFNGGDKNTFYTTSYNEALYYINNHRFNWDYGKGTHYIQGYIYKNKTKETVPLYRLFNGKIKNTFYTTSYNEAIYSIKNWDFNWDYGKNTHYIQGYLLK